MEKQSLGFMRSGNEDLILKYGMIKCVIRNKRPRAMHREQKTAVFL